MKRVFLSLVLLPFVLSASVSSEHPTGDDNVDALLDSLDNNLSSLSTQVRNIYNRINSYYNQAVELTDYYQKESMLYPDDDQMEGMAAGAYNVNQIFHNAVTTVRDQQTLIENDIAVARSDLVALATAWPAVSSEVLQAISNNTDVISLTVATNAAVCVSNIQIIAKLIRSVFPLAPSDSPELTALQNDVFDLVIDFGSYWTKSDSLLDWMMDETQRFREFFNVATSRLKSPDLLCQPALAAMWNDVLQHRRQVLEGWQTNSVSYSLDDQTQPFVSQLGGDFRLSNEGIIALQNLAVNQRTYLVLTELLSRPTYTSNVVDLAWITNYLGTVQYPFFSNYNDTFSVFYPSLFNPYTSENQGFSLYTNFTARALNPYFSQSNVSRSFFRWKRNTTNTLERIEYYLLSLNGFMPQDDFHDDNMELDNNLDPENMERSIEYSTNRFANVITQYGNVSNTLNVVIAKFDSLAKSFVFEMPSGSDDFDLCPRFTLGSFTIEPISFSASNWQQLTNACRRVFSVIWYAIFALLAFKLVLYIVYLVGKTIAHTVLVISTLLS